MIIVKATAESERGDMPTEPLMAAMARYHEELARAGVLLDGSGLKPSAQGWRVRYGAAGARTTITDGPFTEAKDLVGGFTLVEARDIDHAVELSRGCPILDGGGSVEVRPVMKMDM